MIVQQPSSKRPIRSSAKKKTSQWWVWQRTAAWGTAFLFFLASFLFLTGSFMRLFQAVSTSRQATRAFILTPYFLGSLCFTAGCALPVPRTFLQWRRTTQHSRRKIRGRSDREVERARRQTDIARIDFFGAVLAVLGGLCITSATSVDLYLGSKAEFTFTDDEEFLWKVTVPTMVGRALFMLAGWFTWAARNESWHLTIHRGSQHFWWASVLFWVGACGFYYAYFDFESPFQWLPSILVSNWYCILTGYVFGSICLLAASYIMILELAAVQNKIDREVDPSEVPLITV